MPKWPLLEGEHAGRLRALLPHGILSQTGTGHAPRPFGGSIEEATNDCPIVRLSKWRGVAIHEASALFIAITAVVMGAEEED